MKGSPRLHPSYDASLWSSTETYRQFARLPTNASDLLAKDTITLCDPALALPVRSIDRRRTCRDLLDRYYQQILYGCTNSQCETPSCLSRQKRISKGPFRPYTVLSARTLAAFLASRDHPEKGLCPHELVNGPGSEPASPGPWSVHPNGFKNTLKSRGKFSKPPRNPKLVPARSSSRHESQNISSEPSQLDVSIHLHNGHTKSPKPSDVRYSREKHIKPEPGDTKRKKKDTESFTQNLFDTAAMKVLHLANLADSYFQWLPSLEEKQPSTKNGDIINEIRLEEGDRPGEQQGDTENGKSKSLYTEKIFSEELVYDPSESDAKSIGSSGPRPEFNTEVEKTKVLKMREEELSLPPTKSDTYHQGPLKGVSVMGQAIEPSRNKPKFKDDEKRTALSTSADSPAAVVKKSEPDSWHLPQSLSHFTYSNITELIRAVYANHLESPVLLEELCLLQSLGLTINANQQAGFPHGQAEQYKQILAYSAQSTSFILSNVEPLLQSFLICEASDDSAKVVFSDTFPSIVASFRALQMADPISNSIYPNLWVSAGSIYVSGFARTRHSKRRNGSGITRSSHDQVEAGPQMCLRTPLNDLEACHISKVILAALVASVPKCGPDMWLAFSKLHASGQVAPDSSGISSSSSREMIESVLKIGTPFEDELLLSIMKRLVRAVATRKYMVGSPNHRPSKVAKGAGNQDPRPSIIELLFRYLISSSSTRVLTKDHQAQPTIQGGRLLPASKKSMHNDKKEHRFNLLIIFEWLRSVILKEWDGKVKVPKCGAVGGAMELMSYMYHETLIDTDSDVLQTPFLSQKLDVMTMPPDWLNSPPDSNSVHVLSYPFLFPHSVLVSYFRAINHAAMYKAFEDSVVDSRLAKEMTFSDPTTGRGEIRLHHRLKFSTSSYLVLEISREDVLTDALNQLSGRHKCELMRPLKIRMGMEEGEEGVDHGGVQQEFFRVAIAEALNPDYGTFTTDPETRMSWFHPRSLEPLWKFELLGLLTSLAVYNGLTLPFTFPRALYQKLAGVPVDDINSIEDGWPELAKGLKTLRDWTGGDVEDIFTRAYVFSVDIFGTISHIDLQKAIQASNQLTRDHSKHMNKRKSSDASALAEEPLFDSHKILSIDSSDQGALDHSTPALESSSAEFSSDLTFQGNQEHPLQSLTQDPSRSRTSSTSSQSPVMVTDANRDQYIADYITYLTDISVAPQYEAFARGFFTCIPRRAIQLFTATSLKTLVEGLPSIDVRALHKASRYEGGYHVDHTTITQFWTIVFNWSQEKVHQLLEFVTASDRLPVGGAERVVFVVQKNGEGDARLPTSLTCFGRLLLPEYSSLEAMKAGLEKAIENSKGFGQP